MGAGILNRVYYSQPNRCCSPNRFHLPPNVGIFFPQGRPPLYPQGRHATEGGQVFHAANNPEAIGKVAGFQHLTDYTLLKGLSEIEANRYHYNLAFSFIKAHPFIYLSRVADRFLRFWRLYPHLGFRTGADVYGLRHLIISILSFGSVLLFALGGIFYSFKKWKIPLLFYLLILYYSGIYILIIASIRYRAPIMPYMIIFASYGFYLLTKKGDNAAENTK